MHLFQQFSNLRLAKRLDQVAGTVAARSHSAVAEQIRGETSGMGRAETQGYVRAMAAAVVHREVSLVLASEGQLPTWCRREVVDRATDLVVADVSREIVSRAKIVSPHRRAG